MNRTDRLYALVEELRAAAPQWRSASSLAEHFEVSRRTIERDLSALQHAGVPIYATPGRRGGFALDLRHTLPPLNLTAAEVAAVASALAVETSTPFTHAGRTALQKILAVLREVDADGTRELAARVRLFDEGEGEPRSVTAVERAIVEQRVVEIDYVDKHGQFTARTVEPVAVLGVKPHWYLWGFCRLRRRRQGGVREDVPCCLPRLAQGGRSMTRTITIERTIAAPRTRVWAVLADYPNIMDWNDGVANSFAIGDQLEGVGAQRKCELTPSGAMRETVTEWSPEEKMVIAIDQIEKMPVNDATMTFTLADRADKTSVTMRYDYVPKGGPFGFIIAAVLSRPMNKGFNGFIDSLERAAQARTAG